MTTSGDVDMVNGVVDALRDTSVPGDDRYDDLRRVWNAAVDRHPRLIVRCHGTADVVDALAAARQAGLPVGLRSGGHDVGARGLIDGGMLVDLSPMRGVWVDGEARTAHVQPGVVWGDLDREVGLHGLAAVGGVLPSPGVAGLTLGGGVGWLVRRFGLSCDNLVSAEVVLADGSVRRVSANEDPELFWGLRGGGATLAAVTELELALHPVGTVVAGFAIFRGDEAAEVLPRYVELAEASATTVSSLFEGALLPPAEFIPAELHGTPGAVVAFCASGPVPEGRGFGDAMLQLGDPLFHMVSEMPFPQVAQTFADDAPPGSHYIASNHFFTALDREAQRELVAATEQIPELGTVLAVHHLAGAMSAVPVDETAFAHRSATWAAFIIGMSPGAAGLPHAARWVEQTWQRLAPYATGGMYLNFTSEATPAVVDAIYPAGVRTRLAELKRRVDPDDLFQGSQRLGKTGGR